MKILIIVSILIAISLIEARKGDSRENNGPAGGTTVIIYEKRIKDIEIRYEALDISLSRINRRLGDRIDDLEAELKRLEKRLNNLNSTNSNGQNGQNGQNNNGQNSNNNDNNNNNKLVIDKGVWKFDGLFDGDGGSNGNKIVKKTVIAKFSSTFKKTPKIFYTLKTNNVVDNKAALYKIYNELVDLDKNTLSASIDFYGTFKAIELEFEWVAIAI